MVFPPLSHYTIDQFFQAQSKPSFFNVVDGPLKVRKLDFGSDTIYDVNPTYPGPKVHFNCFVFKFIETDGAMVQQIESGSVDLIALPTELWKDVRNLPDTHLEQLSPSAGIDIIELNFQNPKVTFPIRSLWSVNSRRTLTSKLCGLFCSI